MRSFPQELLFALVFGAALLVQFLFKRLRTPAALTKAEERKTEAEAELEAQTALFPLLAARKRAEADAADAARAIESPQSTPETTAAQVSPRTWRRPQRFSRTALMRDRRAVQDAVVIAAILRPCHAHRPHDVD